MAAIVLGLMQDAHQARGAVRALDDAGFERDEIDVQGGLLQPLIERGVPETEANYYAEAARRGGMVVCVCADDESEAERAAGIMYEHGALDIEACAECWEDEPSALVVGEYPAGPGRIYPRT
jgi:hypothetical protein